MFIFTLTIIKTEAQEAGLHVGFGKNIEINSTGSSSEDRFYIKSGYRYQQGITFETDSLIGIPIKFEITRFFDDHHIGASQKYYGASRGFEVYLEKHSISFGVLPRIFQWKNFQINVGAELRFNYNNNSSFMYNEIRDHANLINKPYEFEVNPINYSALIDFNYKIKLNKNWTINPLVRVRGDINEIAEINPFHIVPKIEGCIGVSYRFIKKELAN